MCYILSLSKMIGGDEQSRWRIISFGTCRPSPKFVCN